MKNTKDTVGDRIRTARKSKGLNQSELATLLGKSLRTIQKYESGEIEVSVSLLETIANKLDTSTALLIGCSTNTRFIENLSDIINFFFQLNNMQGIDYSIDIKKPPLHEGWECTISFNGKNMSSIFNSDICLFLEELKIHREELKNYILSQDAFENWKDKTISHYAGTMLEEKTKETLDEETRIKKRNILLNNKN